VRAGVARGVVPGLPGRVGALVATAVSGLRATAASDMRRERVPDGGSLAERAWPAPEPLDVPAAVSPFPTEVLPDALQAFVDAVATSTQTAPDLAGMLILAVLAVLAGGRAWLTVRPDWREPLCLFVVVVADPAERKSAVMERVTAPLRAVEREALDAARPIYAARQDARRIAEKRHEAAVIQAGKLGAAAELEADVQAARTYLDGVPDPRLPRLLVDDATPEALARVMAEQGGRLGVLSAEGGLFATIAGRYSNGVPNLDLVLKAHAGEPYRVDRAGAPPLVLEATSLTLGLAVQAITARQVYAHPDLNQRGLTARLLTVWPASRVGLRLLDPPAVPPEVDQGWAQTVRGLAAALGLHEDHEVRELHLDPQALGLLDSWRAGWEPRLHRDDGDLGQAGLGGWAGKLPGAAARIAALLALASDPACTSVGPGAVRAGLAIADYLTVHALARHTAADEPLELRRARSALGHVQRLARPRVSVRDVQQRVKGSALFPDAAAVVGALEDLAERGYLRPVETEDGRAHTGGRRPSPVYEVHPDTIPLTSPTAASPASPTTPGLEPVPGEVGKSAVGDGHAGGLVYAEHPIGPCAVCASSCRSRERATGRLVHPGCADRAA